MKYKQHNLMLQIIPTAQFVCLLVWMQSFQYIILIDVSRQVLFINTILHNFKHSFLLVIFKVVFPKPMRTSLNIAWETKCQIKVRTPKLEQQLFNIFLLSMNIIVWSSNLILQSANKWIGTIFKCNKQFMFHIFNSNFSFNVKIAFF